MHKKDLILELFPHCNMNCSFCMQSKLSRYKHYGDRRYFNRDIKFQLIKKATDVIVENNIPAKTIELWGGEIFYDTREDYVNLMLDLIKKANIREIEVTTNLVYDLKTNPLIQMFNSVLDRFSLCISYDPLGRFNNEEFKLFDNNVKILLDTYFDDSKKIEFEAVLQEEVLLKKVNLDYLKFLNKYFSLLFILDYRGYSEETKRNFPEIFYNFMKDFESSTFVSNILSNDSGKICCLNGTRILSYVDNFKLNPQYTSCITHESFVDDYTELRSTYKCECCEYEAVCSEMCPSVIKQIGLLRQDIPCYIKYFRNKMGINHE